MLLLCTFLYVVFSFLSANSHLPSQRVPVNCCAKDLHVHICRSLWSESPSGAPGWGLSAHRAVAVCISKATCSRSALFRFLFGAVSFQLAAAALHSLSPQPPDCQLSEARSCTKDPTPRQALSPFSSQSLLAHGDPAQNLCCTGLNPTWCSWLLSLATVKL